MKEKYNFITRLLLCFPCLLIAGILWAILGLISMRSLGKVLKKTGEGLLADEKKSDMAQYEYKNGIMTVTYPNGDKERFKGDSTVWYKLPDFKMCGTFTNRWLHEKREQLKYLNKIATATVSPDERNNIIDNTINP